MLAMIRERNSGAEPLGVVLNTASRRSSGGPFSEEASTARSCAARPRGARTSSQASHRSSTNARSEPFPTAQLRRTRSVRKSGRRSLMMRTAPARARLHRAARPPAARRPERTPGLARAAGVAAGAARRSGGFAFAPQYRSASPTRSRMRPHAAAARAADPGCYVRHGRPPPVAGGEKKIVETDLTRRALSAL